MKVWQTIVRRRAKQFKTQRVLCECSRPATIIKYGNVFVCEVCARLEAHLHDDANAIFLDERPTPSPLLQAFNHSPMPRGFQP